MSQEIRFGKGEKLRATKLNRLSELAQAGNPLSSDDVGVTASGWYNRAKNAIERIFKPRFGVYKYGPNSVRIRPGRWTRDGTVCTFITDFGEVFKTLTGFSASSTTYYVYARLDVTGGTPTYVELDKVATTEPTDDAQNLYRILAIVTTGTDSEINSITQLWTGGDIDDHSYDETVYWKSGEDVASSPTCYADEIWDSTATFKSIDLINSILRNASGHTMVAWDEDSGGRVEVGDGSNGKDLRVNRVSSTGGTCEVEYRFLIVGTSNEWRDDHFHVDISGTCEISPQTDSTHDAFIGRSSYNWRYLYLYCDDLIVNNGTASGTGWTGTFTNGDGATVSVVNGIITDVS